MRKHELRGMGGPVGPAHMSENDALIWELRSRVERNPLVRGFNHALARRGDPVDFGWFELLAVIVIVVVGGIGASLIQSPAEPARSTVVELPLASSTATTDWQSDAE